MIMATLDDHSQATPTGPMIRVIRRRLALRCADQLEPTLDGSGTYYESIDLDAFHPQTILAYQMNGRGSAGCPRRAASPARRAPPWLQASRKMEMLQALVPADNLAAEQSCNGQ
jgi:hypothetical protein